MESTHIEDQLKKELQAELSQLKTFVKDDLHPRLIEIGDDIAVFTTTMLTSPVQSDREHAAATLKVLTTEVKALASISQSKAVQHVQAAAQRALVTAFKIALAAGA